MQDLTLCSFGYKTAESHKIASNCICSLCHFEKKINCKIALHRTHKQKNALHKIKSRHFSNLHKSLKPKRKMFKTVNAFVTLEINEAKKGYFYYLLL